MATRKTPAEPEVRADAPAEEPPPPPPYAVVGDDHLGMPPSRKPNPPPMPGEEPGPGDVGPGPEPPAEPLAISNVDAVATGTSALVTWDTNVPGDSQVDYGPDSSLGTSFPVPPGDLDSRVTTHSVQLDGLTPATTVHYAVRSAPETGESATSTTSTFDVPAA